MTVEEYRTKVKRCRTCIYARSDFIHWHCEAKGKRYSGGVEDTRIRGIFCDLYKPMEVRK